MAAIRSWAVACGTPMARSCAERFSRLAVSEAPDAVVAAATSPCDTRPAYELKGSRISAAMSKRQSRRYVCFMALLSETELRRKMVQPVREYQCVGAVYVSAVRHGCRSRSIPERGAARER